MLRTTTRVELTAFEEERLAALRVKKTQDSAEKARLERTLSDLDGMIEQQVVIKQIELAQVRKAAEELEEELKELCKPAVKKIRPPGPERLLWVDGQAFMFISAVIIIANIVTMVLEMLYNDRQKPDTHALGGVPPPRHEPWQFFWLDQFYMIFYVVELVLKAALWHWTLLFGRLSLVWWNWLDLAIVVSGCLDMYLKPLLLMTGFLGKGQSAVLASVSKVMRIARLARLLRILKIVRVFFESDLSFVDGERFKLFIMSVIGFNCIVMGFETDNPKFWGWIFVEHPLLIIFSFELLVRLKYEGCRFFYKSDNLAWNYLDFVIVAGGVIDMWLMPSIAFVQEMMGHHSEHSHNMGQAMTMLRMARLLRLLRLARLMRSIPPLFHLVMGIMQAVQGMAWVLVLTFVLLYAFSLLAVRLVGHGLVFGGEAPPDVAEVFPAIFPSMYVLFMVMNGNFNELDPLFDALPGTEIIFIAFMVLASWSVLAILTAVVSENMIKSTEDAKEQEEEEEQSKRVEESRSELDTIFSAADVDGGDRMSKEEFDAMIQDSQTLERLQQATGMEQDDLSRIFDYLSAPDNLSPGSERHIAKKQFINGLQDDEAPVTERDVFRIEQQLSFLEFVVLKGHADIMNEMRNWQRRTGTVAEGEGKVAAGNGINGR